MRVSREKAEQNRQRVLETAAGLFRERGIEGVGVAELMKAAGLTHGGFYGQFDSKEDLASQATALALEENADNWDRLLQNREDPWAAFKRGYLSSVHCEHPEAGCTFTALASEAPRRGKALQAVLTRGLKSLLPKLENVVPRRRGKSQREQAMVALSTLVGAVVLARAVDDRALADELLETVKNSI